MSHSLDDLINAVEDVMIPKKPQKITGYQLQYTAQDGTKHIIDGYNTSIFASISGAKNSFRRKIRYMWTINRMTQEKNCQYTMDDVFYALSSKIEVVEI